MSDSRIVAAPRSARPIADLSRYVGMSAPTGGTISGLEHVRQSIFDILRTYPGERVMRPEYGSRIMDLIDRPVNADWLADLYFEVALALARWEPRVRVLRVGARIREPGKIDLTVLILVGDQAQRLDVAYGY